MNGGWFTSDKILQHFRPLPSYTTKMRRGQIKDYLANDNNRGGKVSAPIGSFGPDCVALCNKWGLDNRETMLFGMSFNAFTQAAAIACGAESLSLVDALPVGEVRTTAAAIGLVHLLMSLVDSLPDQEARLVLDRLSEETARTVRKLVGRG